MFPNVTWIPRPQTNDLKIPRNALQGESAVGQTPWPNTDDRLSTQDETRLRSVVSREQQAVAEWFERDGSDIDLDPRPGRVAMHLDGFTTPVAYQNGSDDFNFETNLDVRLARRDDGSVHAEMVEDLHGNYSNIIDLDPQGQVSAFTIRSNPREGLHQLEVVVTPQGTLSYQAS